ncbi:polysaccharide deacetylase family protein [Mycolicibacterium lacusdiani]|uniref:polysaccharide deacetylase family protein n=1 Tax=Mycolicibacterium lacusdiani TaxID=2895283 RepID=UPI001EFFE2F5|nr:polysaccharide deacetylase family protein [Mycolicibacterium lacusdiani]
MTNPPDRARDMVGYGAHPPDPKWPGEARIAVQFVLNYEEGGESNVLHGDAASETFLSDVVGAQPFPNRRMSVESLYEYGSRAGLWRLLRMFDRHDMPLTVFGVATALATHPEAVAAFAARGDEIACHGLRWLSYQLADPEIEREHMARAVSMLAELTGAAPRGWYTGRDSPHTRGLVVEHGGFLYDSDSYAFDVLYSEGEAGAPKMMSVGLHCRLAGRPGRAAALERFIDHVRAHDRVWIARRIDIAEHWVRTFPPGA